MKKLTILLTAIAMYGCANSETAQLEALEKVNIIQCGGDGFERLVELPDYLVIICANEASTRAVLERHH